MRASLCVLVMAAGGLVAGSAWAEDNAAEPERAIELRYGKHGGITQYGAALRFGDVWSRQGDYWSMRLQPVVEVGQFRYDGSRAPDDRVNYGSVGLGFRMSGAGEKVSPYLELGLGGALLSQTRLGPRELSTRFQFTEWIGVGLDFGKRYSIGWRYAHFSNAGIKKPNDGIDVQQIVLSARF